MMVKAANVKAVWNVIMFTLIILTAKGKKKNKALEMDEDEEDLNADIYCKNLSRLIRMEKADEFIIADSFINTSIQLECKFCEEKDNGMPKIWSWQRHIFTGNITELQPDMNNNLTYSSMYVTKSHSLVFKSLKESNMGLYFCKAPYIDSPDKSFNYLVDLRNKTRDELKGSAADLKNYTTLYLAPTNKLLSNKIFELNKISVKMKVYTDWSDWSECNSCFRKEGIRFRLGKCRVKPICESRECLDQRKHIRSILFNDKQNVEKPNWNKEEVVNPETVEKNIMELSIALSCRSFLLNNLVPYLYNITSAIPDFLLYEKCTAPCKGRTLKKGPRYRKSIILARGAHLTLVCPDSSIDSDVQWEHNKLRLHPNEGTDYIPGSTEPRLYVDSFNTLYLIEVTDREAGNYTCFVNGERMQEVKVIVITRSLFFTKEFTRHLKYLGFVFLICFIGYLAGVTVFCVKSKPEYTNYFKRHNTDEEKLLKKKKRRYDSDSSYSS